MAVISNIRANGQSTSIGTPVIGGLNPIFTWDFEDDPASFAYENVEIRIGTSETYIGDILFSGNVYNEILQITSNSFEYDKHNLSRGTVYFGQMRVQNPDGDWTTWAAFSFSTNQLPFVSNYRLSPSSPTNEQDIDLLYTYHDADDHEQSGTKIRWYKNNLPVSAYDDKCTLPSSATTPGESWTAKIIPSDGLEFGAVVETSAVIILESDASFESVEISPTDGNVDDIFKVEYTLTDNEYLPASTEGTIEIEWYVNGAALEDSNQIYIRPEVEPGDSIYAVVKLKNNGTAIAQKQSNEVTISDVPWYVYNLLIGGLVETDNVVDLEPILEWNIHKTTATSPDDRPSYLNIKITTTPSLQGAIYDSGFVEYLKDSFVVPSGILKRGRQYFIHVGAGDSTSLTSENYVSKEIKMAGSAWANEVSNATGWTIDTRLQLETSGEDPDTANLGIYIHDGTYFCSVTFGVRSVTILSDESETYTYASDVPSLLSPKTFRIAVKGQDIKVFMNNTLIINATGFLTNESQLKFIEFGDIDTKRTNSGIFRFLRYSLNGPYGFGLNLTDENTYYFNSIGFLEDGSVDYTFENLLAWKPDDESESSKLIAFDNRATAHRLQTANRNYSPITKITIDRNRNKFIGTANGITAIYGEKHDPDYTFSTSEDNVQILPKDFDRISTVSPSQLDLVEPDIRSGWFTIDTTYRAIGVQGQDNNVPDPYLISSHAVHYYSQRTHGHSWFDNVDNQKGWRVSFSFDIDYLEGDDFDDEYMDKNGFGVYVNDGTRQEIIYFYEDRIRLFYANVFVAINTTVQRDYSIVGKGDNLYVYQRRTGSNLPYSLLINASGLFTTPSVNTGNSGKPKLTLDSQGLYHAVWHDDSNHRSQIFYSIHDGSSWSLPEQVSQSSQFSMRNADLHVDSIGRVWVVYEDTSWGPTEIVCSVRDSVGWNPKVRITNSPSDKGKPAIKIDSDDNVHVVWQDKRNGHWEILWAQWKNSVKAWISSGQFGSDEVIMTFYPDDPYQDKYIDFRNPQIDLLGDLLWVVAEGYFFYNTSGIFAGYRNLEDEFWNSSGSKITDADGDVIGTGTSILLSQPDRNSILPSIAANNSRDSLVIVWEDQTEPITQIWGAAIDSSGTIVDGFTQITSTLTHCSHPSVGWAANMAVILFQRDNRIYLAYYDGILKTFNGSATGDYDRLLDINSSKIAGSPAMAKISPSRAITAIYEYRKDSDPYVVSSIEHPDFRLIGDVFVDHTESVSGNSVVTITSTLADGSVSDVDTKEFAFGDFSENVGLRAHWKDIDLYFGYDAKPHSIIKYNTDTVQNWPNNRINDLFIDYWGNMVAATFGGLVYMNVSTGVVTNIQGQTSDYDSSQGCTESTCILKNKLTTSVAWGKNGLWYVGTTNGLFVSKTAGRVWEQLFKSELENKVIYDIKVDSKGRAVIASAGDIFVAHPDMTTPIVIGIDAEKVKSLAIDELDIVWAATDVGLFRITGFSDSNVIKFSRAQGMRSSHVNGIAIVNKNLRYVATAAGIERMYGTRFTNFNVDTHAILNSNIASIYWDSSTKSLWAGSLYQLHEIVFRDPELDIIDDEVVAYDNNEISTEISYDKSVYSVLDLMEVQKSGTPLSIEPSSVNVFINKNPIEFGYVVSQTGDSVMFLTDLIVNDSVEIEISDQFLNFHDFNQSDIEKSVKGEKITTITKMDRTSRNQLLLLSGTDKHAILLYAGTHALPFTTVMLDRDLPVGCIEKLDIVSRNVIKFRILAYDTLSGLDGMILSNYENFTTDGENEQDYSEFSSVVNHNIGNSLTNVIDSLNIPSSVTINEIERTVGNGSVITKWFDEDANKEYLFMGTSSPAVVFKYDPAEDEWTALQAITPNDQTTTINNLETINNVIWMTTGSNSSDGGIWKSDDGASFSAVGGVTGSHARGIAGSSDGTVYFGSSDGKIYNYKNNTLSSKSEHQNIGSAVYDIEIFGNTLVATTGNNGRIYSIDLTTDDNIIVFSGTETYINKLHIKDSEVITSPDEAVLFAGSGESTTIYRCTFADFSFVKSFASVSGDINRITQVDTVSLVDPSEATGVSGTTVIAAIQNKIFKFTGRSWEFVYEHSEEISDVIQFFTNGTEGLWIVSDNSVTKWTAVRSTKTVYLKLKDKAGNVSREPVADGSCPSDDTEICCDYAYAINIADLQGFVNEGRIVDVSEYGEILFSYDSPNSNNFYSANQIDEEIGIYISEIFNGSNDLVSWKTITWESSEPTGTDVNVQIRTGVSEDDTSTAEWSANLTKNDIGNVSLEHLTDQYLQFRVILTSQIRDVTPTLTSVTITNITAQSSHFFTTNFVLPSRPIKGLLTANTFIPISADVVFGINTKDSTDFGDYQIIESNRVFTTTHSQFGSNLRIGARLLSPGIPQLSASHNPGDPYDESSMSCIVSFDYINPDNTSHTYHFRVRFYSDLYRTQLAYTFYTGNDQTGWAVNGGIANSFPAGGKTLAAGNTANVTFTPGSLIETNKKYYTIIDAWNGSSYETLIDNQSFICSDCNLTNDAGLVGEYYSIGGPIQRIPDFSALTPDYIYVDYDINWDIPSGSPWVTSSGINLGSDFVDLFAARWQGRILISTAGTYEFALVSDDGSKLFIDFEEIIDRDSFQSSTTQTRGSVTLTEGYHDIEVQYFNSLGPNVLQLYWRPPGETSDSIVPSNKFFHTVTSEYCYEGTLPKIFNFGILFELENGETVKVNLS